MLSCRGRRRGPRCYHQEHALQSWERSIRDGAKLTTESSSEEGIVQGLDQAAETRGRLQEVRLPPPEALGPMSSSRKLFANKENASTRNGGKQGSW